MEFTIDNYTFKDATTYSRDAAQRIPTSWETEVGELRIYITCGHRDYKPLWVFHCFKLGFDTKQINAKSKEEAAKIAIGICKNKISSLYKSFFQ